MSWHTSIEVIRGNLVVVRQAHQQDDRAALRRAAQVTQATIHRGCEQFIAFDERPGVSIMLTSFVGERSIHTHPPCSFAGVLAIGTHMRKLLDSIHLSGTTHGGIQPRRIVLDVDGDPVLCNFVHGSRRSEMSMASWNSRTHADRNALATVLTHLCSVVTEPRTPRNLLRRRQIDLLISALHTLEEPNGSHAQEALISHGSPVLLG